MEETAEVAYYKGSLDGLGGDINLPSIIVAGFPDGSRYWPVRAVCDAIGLSSASQIERLRADGDFARELRDDIKIPTTQGMRKAVFINEDALGGWLATIQSAKVRPEIQERVLQFRKIVWRFARAVFNGTLQPLPPSQVAPPPRQKLSIEETIEELRGFDLYLEKRQTNNERHTPVPIYVVDEAELDGKEAGIVRVPFICDGCGKSHVLRLRLRAAIAPEILGFDEED